MAEYQDADPGRWQGGEEAEASASLPAFLNDPAGVLSRRWMFSVAALVLGLIATGVAVYVMRPTFLADATILITRQQIPEEFVRSTVEEDADYNLNVMIGEVLSRGTLARLVEDLGMIRAEQSEVTLQKLVGQLRSNIEIMPGQSVTRGRGDKATIYGVAYRSEDPIEAATVANAVAGLFSEASLERRSTQARRTTTFLTRQLERDEAELRAQSELASEFRRKNRGELPSELETNIRRLQMLSERRQSLVTQIASKENHIASLQAMPRSVEKSENEMLLDTLRSQLAAQIAANTDAHPNVIALRERIERLDTLVQEDRKAGEAPLRIEAERRELALLKRQVAETRTDITDLDARIDRTHAIGEDLETIVQKEQVLRERYLGSLRKVEDSQLAENLESAQHGAHISVLDRATVPGSPERPPWIVAMGGVVASFGLALAVAILLELVDPVIVSTRQLEELADGPCLGSFRYVA